MLDSSAGFPRVAAILCVALPAVASDALAQTYPAPEMKERLAPLGLEPAAEPLDKTNAYIKSEIAKWAQVVKAANITAG